MTVIQNNINQERVQALREQFLAVIWISFRRMVQQLQCYSLTHPQFVTLFSLVAHGKPATMRQLTEVALQDAPTMTGIVNRLVKMKLVQRTRREDDRRIVWVEATPKAITLVNDIQQDLQNNDLQGFGSLSNEQILKMEEILDHLLTVYLQNLHPHQADINIAKKNLYNFANNPINFIQNQTE